jgi:trk system potassium uptake protein TrkA
MMKSENILLLGLGGMGEYLAKRLSMEGHLVTVIESDREKIRKGDAELDARLIHGSATDFTKWDEAEAAKMDYLIATTDDDAVNLVAAMIGHKYGIEQKIARSRGIAVWDEDAVLPASDLGIDLVIRPEELTAQEIVRILKMRAGNVLVDVGDGDLQVLATNVGPFSPMRGMQIKELSGKFEEFVFRIGCVTRDIDTLIPDGDFQLETDDRIYLIAGAGDMPKLMDFLEVRAENRHNVLIIGGALIGARVAELLESSYSVTLLERDESRAEELSHLLKSTEVLHGDGSDRETLVHAGLLNMDTIVATTGDNETNIMASVLAKHLIHTRSNDRHAQLAKTIALVKRHEYLTLAATMGTDVALNRKILAANAVLRHIRRDSVLSVAHLHGCDAEVVELFAETGSPITKRPLFEQEELRGRITIGAVAREKGWQVAVGSTKIEGGDRVVCVCTEEHLGHLQRLFFS